MHAESCDTGSLDDEEQKLCSLTKGEKKVKDKKLKKKQKKEKKRRKKEKKKEKKILKQGKSFHGKKSATPIGRNSRASSTSESASSSLELSTSQVAELFTAAVLRNDVVKARHILMRAGASWQDKVGDGPLHIAARENQLALVDYLLRHEDAEVLLEHRNAGGETPLLIATRRFRGRISLRLLHALADPGAMDLAGETPEMMDLNGLLQEAAVEEGRRQDEAANRLIGAVAAAREAREAAEFQQRLFEEASGDFAGFDAYNDLEYKDRGSHHWTEDVVKEMEARELARKKAMAEAAFAKMKQSSQRIALEAPPASSAAPPTTEGHGESSSKRGKPAGTPRREAGSAQEDKGKRKIGPERAPPAEQSGGADARSKDERRWQAFQETVDASTQALSAKDIPFPSGPKSNPLHLDFSNHPALLRSQLRAGLLRWHPDKFEQRFGGCLPEDTSSRARVLERVKNLAQQLTEMMAQLPTQR